MWMLATGPTCTISSQTSSSVTSSASPPIQTVASWLRSCAARKWNRQTVSKGRDSSEHVGLGAGSAVLPEHRDGTSSRTRPTPWLWSCGKGPPLFFFAFFRVVSSWPGHHSNSKRGMLRATARVRPFTPPPRTTRPNIASYRALRLMTLC